MMNKEVGAASLTSNAAPASLSVGAAVARSPAFPHSQFENMEYRLAPRLESEDLCDFLTRCVAEARGLLCVADQRQRRAAVKALFVQAKAQRRPSEQFSTSLGGRMMAEAGLS